MLAIFVGTLFLIAKCAYCGQSAYEVVQERFIEEYSDKNVIDITCGTYKLNRTKNAINITFKFKTEVTDKDKCFVVGHKWLSNQYRLDILQFQRTVKDIMNIEYFDIDRLLHKYTDPPLIWPIKKGVTYKMREWVPDSSQFPPGVPEGKWKLMLNFTKADSTPFVTVSWLFSISYKIRRFEN